jgi:hypothetical protein
MFSFLRKKSLAKRVALAGVVLVLLTGFLFVSCPEPDGDPVIENKVSAQEPNISAQPAGGSWNVGTTDNFELTVVADVTDGGNLTYQWYSNSTNSNSGGSAINEEKDKTLTLDKEHHTANGNYYFYVVVTNTNNNVNGTKTATAVSNVATVTVSGGVTIVSAQEPSINTQPAATTWNISTDNTKELTVVAEVTDGGVLSYQWYSNTSATTTGGNAIGTNNATLTLAKANYTTDGNYYFYVVVTNTNNNATTTKVVTKTSNAATVTVTGNGGSSIEVVIPAGLNGHFQSELLFYEGWGCSDDAFAVNAATKTFTYYFDSTLENYWGGTIVSISEDKSGDGGEPAIMIIQITGSNDDSGFMTLPTTGKYFAYMYKGLTSFGATSAAAYKYGGKNTGVDTIAEAKTEYTKANGYFDMDGFYTLRTITARDLTDLQGTWRGDEDEGMEDYIISIRGTAYTEFLDDYDDPNQIFDGENLSDDILMAMGEIVDCVTDIGGQSGVLYIHVTDGGYFFDNGKFFAVGWKITDDGMDFATSSEDYDTLALAKTAYGNASVFSADNYNSFTK